MKGAIIEVPSDVRFNNVSFPRNLGVMEGLLKDDSVFLVTRPSSLRSSSLGNMQTKNPSAPGITVETSMLSEVRRPM